MSRHFDGVNDWVSVADNAVLSYGDFTISAMLLIHDIFYTFGYWYSHDTVGTDDSINIFGQSADNQMRALVGLGSGNGYVDDYSVWTYTEGVWFNYILTYDQSAGEINQYLNGVTSGPNSGTPTSSANPIGPLNIGRREDADFQRHFEGDISDIGRWNRILTADEIRMLGVNWGSPKLFRNGLINDIDFVRDLYEHNVPLSLTNNGSIVVEQPPIIYAG